MILRERACSLTPSISQTGAVESILTVASVRSHHRSHRCHTYGPKITQIAIG